MSKRVIFCGFMLAAVVLFAGCGGSAKPRGSVKPRTKSQAYLAAHLPLLQYAYYKGAMCEWHGVSLGSDIVTTQANCEASSIMNYGANKYSNAATKGAYDVANCLDVKALNACKPQVQQKGQP
jgi:hypothetical protein